MQVIFSLALICGLFLSFPSMLMAQDKLQDLHESCDFWASVGECEKNPGYMLTSCSLSCNKYQTLADTVIPTSFYDIIEEDIHGNEVRFSRFKGKVVYVINVASYCGYTESNYAQFRQLKKYYHMGLEIVLAPCNGFGKQEPGSPSDIYAFAQEQEFSGIILSKNEVNGPATRPSFRFLKNKTGRSQINWNFDGKFLIGRDGNVHVVGPDLEDQIQALLGAEAPKDL